MGGFHSYGLGVLLSGCVSCEFYIMSLGWLDVWVVGVCHPSHTFG